MKLISLLERLEYTCIQGSTDQEVKNVVYDSRKVEEVSLFICIRGAVVDGHKFVPDVIAKGAKVKNCVLMQDTIVGEGTKLEYIISDKNVKITDGKELKGDEAFPVFVAKGQVV